jgi:hypothetical protein
VLATSLLMLPIYNFHGMSVAPQTAFEADGGSCLPTPSVLSVPPPTYGHWVGGEEGFVLISA